MPSAITARSKVSSVFAPDVELKALRDERLRAEADEIEIEAQEPARALDRTGMQTADREGRASCAPRCLPVQSSS